MVGTDQPALDEGIDSDGRVRYIFSPEGGRGAQIAYGAAQARGDFIWIVHSDCRPTSAAIADISWILRDVTVSLGAFPLRFSEAHPLFRLYEALSRVDSVATTFGDQGFFCRRTDYIAVDGAPGWRLFEDVELRRRLLTLGRVKKARSQMETSARRFVADGVLRRQIANAWLLARFLIGEDPDQLADEYERGPKRPRVKRARTVSAPLRRSARPIPGRSGRRRRFPWARGSF